MDSIWIVISLLAGILITVRNMVSKKLTQDISPVAITFARFAFAIPFVLAYLFTLFIINVPFGTITIDVLFFSFLSALAQSVASCLLIMTFHHKNFATAVNYTKSDKLFSATTGSFFFNQPLTALSWGAVGISSLGILLTSFHTKLSVRDIVDRGTVIGLLCGFLFSVAYFLIVQTNNSYIGGSTFTNAAVTLALVLVIQTILLFLYIRVFEHIQIFHLKKQVANCIALGASAGFASVCLFTAFSLAPVAYVVVVAQIEILLTVLASVFLLKERLSKYELIGIIMTTLGILLLIFSTKL